ncbi:hypothetical protein CsatB_021984 [Cannabis sativa]
MASASFSSLSMNPSLSLNRSKLKPNFKNHYYYSSCPIIKAQKEDVVIVGAGIAGLATAVSLHRLGVRSLVLEQAESLRTGGTSLTLFKNGWRVLDAIGVGNDLRTQFLEIQGQEVRAVERRVLLETLADQLPPDALRFSSKLSKISKNGNGETMLELVDGSQFSSKPNGWGSLIQSMLVIVLSEGLGYYPNGQPFEPKVSYIYGRGLRAGCVPVSPTKVYWFVCFNRPSPGPKITDPVELKKQAKELVKNWPTDLLSIIDQTPDDTIIRTPLVDRWLWPTISPQASSGGVVLVGDAWHPMTPNLGQGACCALEDAVVLSRKLANAIKSGSTQSVENALSSYGNERWPRVFPLTIRANLVGLALQWDNPIVCSVRNNFVIPKLVRLGPLLEHTNFDCQPL